MIWLISEEELDLIFGENNRNLEINILYNTIIFLNGLNFSIFKT